MNILNNLSGGIIAAYNDDRRKVFPLVPLDPSACVKDDADKRQKGDTNAKSVNRDEFCGKDCFKREIVYRDERQHGNKRAKNNTKSLAKRFLLWAICARKYKEQDNHWRERKKREKVGFSSNEIRHWVVANFDA